MALGGSAFLRVGVLDRVPIRGEGGYAYLSDKVISSGRVYMKRKWICSKPLLYFTGASDFKTWVGNVSTHA
ncbi:hypothetical protein I79_024908 [Cricetulus griseus]|uniref:Uncharacterized protein n=1 Tax=Cricetulus griseus TaxID=10029 RepID=G3ILY2_CRIGR|nr:hypothetical protein I79_024908 [Cricetulus griseus]